jgi:iduronate 2-sulfatase
MQHFRDNGYYAVGSGKLMHHGRKSEWDEFPHEADYGPHAFDGEKRVAHPSVPMPYAEIGATDGSYGSLESSAYLTDGNPESGWVTGSWDKPKLMKFGNAGEREPTPDERNAAWAVSKIGALAKQKKDQPFFLGVGFIRPHTPCVAPQKYFDMFPLDEIEVPVVKDGDADDTHYRDLLQSSQKGMRYYRTLVESYGGDKEKALKGFTQAYLACVAAVDDCIGMVVDAIDNSPFKDNTIIVLTSDHGWQMGQKDYLFKHSPWEESCRVPFVVRAPGVAKAGGVAEHPVSLIDLYPTLIDLCGIEGDTRKNKQGARLSGHSVRPFLENPGTRTWDGPNGALSMIYVGASKKTYSAAEKNDLANQHWSYRTERWRYIRYNDGVEELYDHGSDPREWTNLADSPEHTAVKEKLHREMGDLIGPMKRFPVGGGKHAASAKNKK